MKASELKGRAVVTLQEAEKIGTIDSVICDPNTSRVVGLKIKTGLFSGDRYVRVSDIRSIGTDAVTIPGQDLLHENVQDLPELNGLPELDDVLGTKVVSENGNVVGTIDDVLLDMSNNRIDGYQLGGSFWQHLTNNQKSFSAPVTGLRFGKGLLIVPDAVEAQLRPPAATPEAEPAATPTPAPTPTPNAAATSSDAGSIGGWQAPEPTTPPSAATTALPSTDSTSSYPSLGNLLEPEPTGDSSARARSGDKDESGSGGRSVSGF